MQVSWSDSGQSITDTSRNVFVLNCSSIKAMLMPLQSMNRPQYLMCLSTLSACPSTCGLLSITVTVLTTAEIICFVDKLDNLQFPLCPPICGGWKWLGRRAPSNPHPRGCWIATKAAFNCYRPWRWQIQCCNSIQHSCSAFSFLHQLTFTPGDRLPCDAIYWSPQYVACIKWEPCQRVLAPSIDVAFMAI